MQRRKRHDLDSAVVDRLARLLVFYPKHEAVPVDVADVKAIVAALGVN